MNLYFATSREWSQLTEDDHLLVSALNRQGCAVEPLIWDQSHDIQSPVLIRSVWDYHLKEKKFRTWLEQVPRLLNSRVTVKWNLDKSYLRDLEEKGVPCVPTIFVADQTDVADSLAELSKRNWDRVVVKPSVSATAYLTDVLPATDSAVTQQLQAIHQHSGALIQPYLPLVESEGEISLLYFASQGEDVIYSHSVLKLPKQKDFRVQSDFGGQAKPIQASDALIALGKETLRAVPGDWWFARVDILNWQSNPLIGEIELIEPDLFFRFSQSGADTLAERILQSLNYSCAN